MINNFGAEFVNIQEDFGERNEAFGDALILVGPGLDVGPFFRSIASRALRGGLILYLPPGRYRLPHRDSGLPVSAAAEPYRRTRYELPENVQIYLCQGALLRPEEHVDLIIRGSLRAGKYQVFGYERGRLPSGITGVNTVPKGRVLLWTRLVPAVYPEWWGAPVAPSGNTDSSDALQAAINAACVHRDDPVAGVRRPSIPVLLGNGYRCTETLSVMRPGSTPSLNLILRGATGLATANRGVASITGLATTAEARRSGCVLRLGPGVDFDIQDVGFGMIDGEGATFGCIDIICDETETAPRRGLFRRCMLIGGTDHALRVQASRGTTTRHFVLDACTLSPGNISYLSRAGVDVQGDASVMLHIDGTLMGMSPIPALPEDPSRPTGPTRALPANATLYLQGGSVLVRASQFHNGSGPRPTQSGPTDDSVDLDRPDGQEVFLASPLEPARASATHFTAVHVECQGWWFLSRPRVGEEQVVLLNVTHANVNWGHGANVARYQRPPLGRPGPDGLSTAGRSSPPSVVWLKRGGQCVLVACRFDYTLLTDASAWGNLCDVATVFRTVDERLRFQHFRPDQVPSSISRPPSYPITVIRDDQAFDFQIPHVVPLRTIT